MDVASILNNATNPNYKIALEHARRDKEWLLLPATPTILNGGQIEYSAILDGSCIDFKKIKRL